jgi:MFS family permease
MKHFIDISVLFRNRNFKLLYIGQFISFIGSMISYVALPYQIYHLTKSTLMVGLLSLFQLLPLVISSLFGGVVADRYNRRKLLILAESMLALGCLLLIINAHFIHPHIWFIFLAAVLMSGFMGLYYPASSGLIQQIVDKNDFPSIGALHSFMYSAGMITGPALGGVIIAHLGLVTAYSIDFFSFFISIAALFSLRNIETPKFNPGLSVWASLKEGIRYAKSRQELLGSYLVDFVAMVFGMPMALFPAIADRLGGAEILGLLYSAPAVGSLVISLASGWNKRIRRQGLAIAIFAAFWGVAMIGVGLATNIWWAFLFLIFAGILDTASGMMRGIMWNQTIPNEIRGRLSGIEILACVSGPRLGDAEAGFVAALFGVGVSIISGGILCVVGVAACCYFMPEFIKYRSKNCN